jgi:hypothetical protein
MTPKARCPECDRPVGALHIYNCAAMRPDGTQGARVEAEAPASSRRALTYNRDTLVRVLIYHYRRDASSCGCGWSRLGASHPEHVADVYEASVAANRPQEQT